MVMVRRSVEEDPVEGAERLIVVGVLGFEPANDRVSVGHGAEPPGGRVDEAVQHLEAGRCLTRREIGVGWERQRRIGGGGGLEVDAHRPGDAEVGVA